MRAIYSWAQVNLFTVVKDFWRRLYMPHIGATFFFKAITRDDCGNFGFVFTVLCFISYKGRVVFQSQCFIVSVLPPYLLA